MLDKEFSCPFRFDDEEMQRAVDKEVDAANHAAEVAGVLHPPDEVTGVLHPPDEVTGVLHPPDEVTGVLHPPDEVTGVLHPPSSGMLPKPRSGEYYSPLSYEDQDLQRLTEKAANAANAAVEFGILPAPDYTVSRQYQVRAPIIPYDYEKKKLANLATEMVFFQDKKSREAKQNESSTLADNFAPIMGAVGSATSPNEPTTEKTAWAESTKLQNMQQIVGAESGNTPSKGPDMKNGTPDDSLVEAQATPAGPLKTKPYDVAQELMGCKVIRCIGNMVYIYDETYGVYRPLLKEGVERFILEHCRGAISSIGRPGFLGEVCKFVYAEPRIFLEGCNQPEDLVVFKDCILNTRTWAVHPHSPNHFATTLILANYQRGTQTACPKFDDYINEISGGDSNLAQRIWEAWGYILSSDLSGKCFFVLQGRSWTGKSTLAECLMKLLEPQMVTSLDINSMSKNFALSDVIGKHLVADLDLPGEPISASAASIVKKLTGGDNLSADIKYLPRVTFKNTAKLIFATNHAIVTANYEEAFFKRLIVIPMQYVIDRGHEKRRLPDMFADEYDAIAVKALRYYAVLRENHYRFAGDYRVNQHVEEDHSMEVSLDTQVAAFIANRCELAEGAWTPTSKFHQAFLGSAPVGCNPNTFSESFNRFCSQYYKNRVKRTRHRLPGEPNAVYGYEGIKLRDETEA